MATSSVHQQEGENPNNEYFDIMLIGKTGLGKTTTADKILLANPAGKIYSYDQPQPNNSIEVDGTNEAPILHHEDLSMWHVSDEAGDTEMVQNRLKNLVFCRSLAEPHKEVNRLREQSGITKYCELLSNDTSKVRVLDVPGFFGSETKIAGKDLYGRVEAVASRNLQIMRKILHIKEVYNFKFNRVIYFLPEKGVLNRHSQILQMDIEAMETYFGRSIFDCMVVAATHPTSNYRYFPEGIDLYSQEDYETTQSHFQEALSSVFGDSSEVPKPPIVFLSYRATCDKMLDLIKQAKIVREGVELSFNTSKCARCDITIKKVKAKITTSKEAHGKETKNSKAVPVCTNSVLMCTNSAWSNEIPYNETTCHPMIIPRYTTIQRIAGGIAHLITLRRFKGKWPSFKSFEEVCIACHASPGTRGCKHVGTIYFLLKKCGQCMDCKTCKKCSDQCKKSDEWNECANCKICQTCEMCKKCKECITVDHTSQILENYILDDGDISEEDNSTS